MTTLDINTAFDNLTNPDPNLREEAANFLGQYDYAGDTEMVARVLDALSNALTDPSVEVKLAAASALGIMGNNNEQLAALVEPALEALIAALDAPERGVRFTAASSLGMIGAYHSGVHHIIAPALLNALDRNNEDTGYRIVLIKALGRVASPVAVADLSALLNNGSGDVVRCVEVVSSRALERIATPEAIDAVEQWRQQTNG